MQKWEYCSLTMGEVVPPDATNEDWVIGFCYLDVLTATGQQRHKLSHAEYLQDPRGHLSKIGNLYGEQANKVIEAEQERQAGTFARFGEQIARLGAEGWELVCEIQKMTGDTDHECTAWFKRPIQEEK